jgi:hypothetical protein
VDNEGEYLIGVIHHEFFHLLDFFCWGKNMFEEPDKNWNKLNPPGFIYGTNLKI